MIDWAELTRFLYITARISGFVLFNPLLGRRNIPAPFRVGMTLVLSVFTAALTTQGTPIPVGMAELAVRMLLELAVGFLLGMAASFFFYIPQLSGSIIDTQMGMTMNQMYDPGTSANMSVTGQILNALMTLLFFAAGGHLTLLRISPAAGAVRGVHCAGDQAEHAHLGGGPHCPGGDGSADEGDSPDQRVRHQY